MEELKIDDFGRMDILRVYLGKFTCHLTLFKF
jgi:hypothetical protein